MKKLYSECDACGDLIKDHPYILRLYILDDGKELPAGKEMELCKKCAMQQKRWSKKTAPFRSERKKIDRGMAFALRRRGWTNTQIAEEFDVDPEVMEAVFRQIDKDVESGKLKVEGVNSDAYRGVQGRVKDVI